VCRAWQWLNVEGNALTQLPAWLSHAPLLEHLLVSKNPLSSLPVCVNSWPSLVNIVANDCDFGAVGIVHMWRDFEEASDAAIESEPQYKRVRGE
jgi:hypothetical protein